MSESKVSIIIPVYNGERYLEETIQSCIKQDYENIEIIVIDDHSIDNSKKIALKYKDNVIYEYNETNLGLAKNFNKAAKMSTGDFILFLGQDDLLPHNHISTIMDEFNDHNSFVYCNSIIIDSLGNEQYKTYDDEKQINRNIRFELCVRNVISSTGLIIRKKAFTNVYGWDEQYRNFGEWLLWTKLLTEGDCKYSVSSTVFYRIHETNITKSFADDTINKELNDFYAHCKQYARDAFYKDLQIKEKLYINIFDKLLPYKKYLKKIF